jgi:hypothetical protein
VVSNGAIRQMNGLRWESMQRKFQISALRVPGSVAPLLALWACTILGCGAPAAPEPPSLNLPIPIMNLTALRIGNSVRLAWTMPTRTTDKVPLRHPLTAQVCRAVQDGLCTDIGSVPLAPGAAGAYTDELPADLAQGPDRLLRYEVAVRNHAGKSAGPSNAAYSAAGPSPPALTGLTWQMRPEGVQLNWQPIPEPGTSVLFRIERLQLTAPDHAPRSPLSPAEPAAAQTLVVHGLDGGDPGHAIDASTVFNQRYRYVLERVATPVLSGKSIEVQGPPSEAIVASTLDTFPPAVPQGLVAVADAAAGAIDLSWSPDSDSDLAAYRIYRRDTHAGLPAQRIASLKVETSFRDTGVQPEHTYAYSVSAIDQSGNESKRSPDIEETLPSR